MKIALGAASLIGLAMVFCFVEPPPAQQRAPGPPPPPPPSQPVQRALPVEESPSPSPTPAVQTDQPERRQLDYANALFTRKLYDLAVPEYQKYLGQYPGVPGRASAYFYLAECYRSLNRSAAARTSFQNVLDNYAESE